MRRRWPILSIAAFFSAMARGPSAAAQPDLPPPPPPPIGEPSDVPSLPPPPAPSDSPGAPPRPPGPPAAPRRALPIVPSAPAVRTRRHIALPAEPARAAPPPPRRPITVSWSPLGLFWGRLSANVEVGVAPHHALTASPNVLVFPADRGGSGALLARGFGFTTTRSASFGAELGYHYWLEGSRLLRGPFAGPSFVFGATSHASVGDPSPVQGYWGFAIDVGTREVLSSGFTAGVGAGLGLLEMAGVTALFPRALVDIGWSF